ncbi:hypothetical protein ZTR_02098 [Talaromyces verruculosus]|nr:hypothetical protein ZTR_02098 [Talaromyces verruculosus]
MLTDLGYGLENEEVARLFAKSRFVLEMTQAEVLALLEHYCDKRLPLVPTHSQLAPGLEFLEDIQDRDTDTTVLMRDPIFSTLHQMGSSANASDGNSSAKDNGPTLIKLVEEAASLFEAANIVANGIEAKLCKGLSLSPESFDVSQPLHVSGMDALMAIEMRNWFMQTLNADVAVFEILGGSPAETLGRAVAAKIRVGV